MSEPYVLTTGNVEFLIGYYRHIIEYLEELLAQVKEPHSSGGDAGKDLELGDSSGGGEVLWGSFD